jgi:hypothetical protein
LTRDTGSNKKDQIAVLSGVESTTAWSYASAGRGIGDSLSDLTEGRAITVYGQHEVVKVSSFRQVHCLT